MSLQRITSLPKLVLLAWLPFQEKHEQTLKALEEPTLDYLSEKAVKNYKSVIIPTDKYESLKENLELPDWNYMTESKSHDSVIVKQNDYNDLVKVSTDPSVQFIEEKARKYNKSVIDSDELKNIKRVAFNNQGRIVRKGRSRWFISD